MYDILPMVLPKHQSHSELLSSDIYNHIAVFRLDQHMWESGKLMIQSEHDYYSD